MKTATVKLLKKIRRKLLTMKEKKIFKKLAEMKWRNKFCCTCCGHNTYISGKSPFSRRCKNIQCRYEESLKRFTVFDGLNIPISKGYEILLDIFNVSRVYDDTDLKIVGHNKKHYGNLGNYIAERNRIKKLGTRKIDSEVTEETVQKHIMQYRKQYSIRNLSKKYGIEENTIVNFLDSFNNRIPLSVVREKDNSYDRLIETFCELFDWDITAFFVLMMTPTPKKCLYGTFTIQQELYSFDFDNLYYYDEEEEYLPKPVLCKAEPEDALFTETMYYKGQKVSEEQIEETHFKIKGGEIEYGSSEWRYIFGIPESMSPS